MSLTTSERHFLFSSNPVMGALNVNSLGNRFSVTFNPPLRFDEKAQQIRMELLESELYYNTPNITNMNNHIRISGPNNSDGKAMIFDFFLTPGLYELETLSTEINNRILELGGKNNIIVLSANASNSRVVITLQYPNTIMYLTVANNIAEIIGFSEDDYPSGSSGNYSHTGLYNPQFNQVNYYTISCDVVPVGLSFNGNNKQVIGRILIGPVDPGEQIVSSPIHPYSIDITTLKNQIIPSVSFWLQDDKGRDVDTLGEFYSFRLRVVTEL
jgi:hypothetical protein